MKLSQFRRIIKEEIKKVLKENVTPEEMQDGIGLPFDNNRTANAFMKKAAELGMKQGATPAMTGKDPVGADYWFDYEGSPDAALWTGKGSEGPSAIFIINPKMQSDSKIQALAKKAMEDYDDY